MILPLTKDVLKFKNYVFAKAIEAEKILKKNKNNKEAFRNLVNTTLTLTILYNRRRIGDVQYITLDTYYKNFSSNNLEEFEKTLTDSGIVLTKQYKRIVTCGKGNRAVVILIPKTIQNFFDTMVEIRNVSTIVPRTNPHLFAHPGNDHN